MSEDLARLRREIRQLDNDIIRLTARRMQLAVAIGNHKVQAGLPIVDSGVEEENLRTVRALADELSLSPHCAEELLKLLMRYAVEEQKKLQKP